MEGRSHHFSAQSPQQLFISLRVKRIDVSLQWPYKVLHNWPLITSLTSLPRTLPWTHSTWSKLALLLLLNVQVCSRLRVFAVSCPFCLEFSFSGYSRGLFLLLPTFAQMSPFQSFSLSTLFDIVISLYNNSLTTFASFLLYSFPPVAFYHRLTGFKFTYWLYYSPLLLETW